MAADFKAPCYALGKLRALNQFFSQNRAKTFARTGPFAIGASECLGLVPLLRHYLVVNDRIAACIPAEVASFNALADVVACLQLLKSGVGGGDQGLERLLRAHGDAFHTAYGPDDTHYLPKFHYAKHVWDSVRQHGCMLDCFAAERKHRILKEAAEALRNTTNFERTVISRVLCRHVHALASGWRVEGLLRPADAADLGPGWTVADRMIWRNCEVTAEDVFLTADALHMILVRACLGHSGIGRLYVLAQLGRPSARLADSASEYETSAALHIVEVNESWRTPPLWYSRAPDRWTVVHR